MTARSRIASLLGTTALAAACASSPDHRAAEEAALHARIQEWASASEAKDLEAFLSVYADDAVLMLEGVPDVEGIDGLREGLGAMMQDPNFALSFAVDEVRVARSGDLAYETGSYTMTVSGPDGAPATQTGHYVVVWEKQPGGAWKVVRDVPVSD